MASDGPSTSAGPSRSTPVSFAEQLQSKHARDAAHNPTVQEVTDEDDIEHPPPSASLPAAADPSTNRGDVPLSEKAMGKQKVKENQPPAKATPVPLDTQSEELFPSLGTPKTAAAKTPVAWGSAKPESLANGLANGNKTAGSVPSSGTTSRTSTPVSTPLTPTAANGQWRPTGAAAGWRPPSSKHAEKWHMRPADLLPQKQMKKKVEDVLRDINRRSRAKVSMSPAPDGGKIFEAQGSSVDAVRQALRDVSKEVGAKQSLKLEVPANASAHIIGRAGITIKDIMAKSGARLQLQKANEAPADADDSATVELTIEGDSIAVALARSEVEAIVNSKAANMSTRLRDIPPELFPFLAGPRNRNVQALAEGLGVDIRVPQYHTWTHRPPPTIASPDDVPAFAPHPTQHITVSGDRRAVQQAKTQLERRAAELRMQIALTQLAISRTQHQFVTGVDGASLPDLLRETGCSVILPPADDTTENVTIVGPRARLEEGTDHVMNLATSMRLQNVDVGRAFPNPPEGQAAYTRALARYLRQRRAIRELEQRHGAHIMLPAGPTWDVYALEGKNAIRAKNDILNLVSVHPPARFRHLDVHPFYHAHLGDGPHCERLLKERGVRLLLPDAVEETPEGSKVLLVFEGVPGTADALLEQRPSPADVAEFERALLAAQDEILGLFADQAQIGTRVVPVPNKFCDKTRKFVMRDQSELPDGHFPIEFLFRPAAGTMTRPDAASPPVTPAPAHDCYIRGPEDRLGELAARLEAFIAAEESDEHERGYTTTTPFPQKHVQHLIGKSGERIRKMAEDFDVELQAREGTVEIKGPKVKAHAAQAHIAALAKKLEDEVAYKIKVKPQFHRDLIGAGGANVNRLQERYGVRIRFPRTERGGGLDDAASLDGSEAGAPRSGNAARPPDEILITGAKQDADKARDELLSLAQYAMDTSHTAIISVAKSHLPSLIGKSGKNMENVRQTTGASIKVPSQIEPGDAAGRVELKIKGTKKQVDDARVLLQQSVAEFDDSVTKEIVVDRRWHKTLIGPSGATIRDIVLTAGGADDRRLTTRMVRFPPAESTDPKAPIRLEGPKTVVNKIASAIEGLVAQRASEVTETVTIPPERHGLLIGPGGETRRALETTHRVKIDIPKQSVQGAARAQVRLMGAQKDVDTAKAKLLELMQSRGGTTVEIPRRLHHAIGDNGAFFRQLRKDHRVTVSHSDQTPPPQPAASSAGAPSATPLPLITDEDAAGEDGFKWSVVERGAAAASDETGTIPWVLSGPSADAVAAASKALKAALARAESPRTTGYLVMPDASMNGRVIGPGGATIKGIRAETGCEIQVPKNRKPGDPIEIVGGRDGVEQAKEMILEIVHRGGGRGRRES